MSSRLTIDPPAVDQYRDLAQVSVSECQVGPSEPDCPYCWGPETD